MNANSERILTEMERRNIPLRKLALSLGMFDFSLQNKLDRGLTDSETETMLSKIQEVDA